MDYTVRIGGEAGQGIQTIGEGLARVFARCGWHVFTHQDYESRIRGGHNIYQLRFADRPVACSRDVVDVLVALDDESLRVDLHAVRAEGFAIYDSSVLKRPVRSERLLDIPLGEIAVRVGGDRITSNVAAIGAVLGMLGMDLAVLDRVIEDSLSKKGVGVVDANREVAAEGYRVAAGECERCKFEMAECGQPRMLMQGVEAIGLGAIASGLKFYSGYPMTPSTGVMLYVNSHGREYGVAVEQAEDEIAAINMALGASFAGARVDDGHFGRRLLPHGGGAGAGRHDRDPGGHRPGAAARSRPPACPPAPSRETSTSWSSRRTANSPAWSSPRATWPRPSSSPTRPST